MEWRCLFVLCLLEFFRFVNSEFVFDSDEQVVSVICGPVGLVNPREFQVTPEIYSMQINANVGNRFARTLITSKVRNLIHIPQETNFSVILPENAFISEFEMEIEGIVYKAYVKEKEEAKQIYQKAVSRGQNVAHVELSARDSKTFTVSVNIEAQSETIFRLVYEELLQRQKGQYELVINIHPRQVVADLGVQVQINETRPLTFVRTPSLRTGNEISKNDPNLDPSAQIDIIGNNTATVKFNPDKSQQKRFAENLGSSKENGLAGQFVVQYDVERDPLGGEVLVRDGYFVHFFAPSELEPLPKHVVFILDHSLSMGGRKMEQLIQAMKNILSELKTQDLFNIIRFANEAAVWDPSKNTFVIVHTGIRYYTSPDSFELVGTRLRNFGSLEPYLRKLNLPEATEATESIIKKAKAIIDDQSDMGSTNIIAGLEVGLFLIKRTQETNSKKYQPMIIFLTDGLPNEGMSDVDEIIETVTKLNSGENRTSLFSLSFGSEADKDFLKKLSSRNLGFSKHIYEAFDASLQLQDFYRTISSPLLSNITFRYVEGVSDVTETRYPILFDGSELVVSGRTGDNPNVLLHVNGMCTSGPINFSTVNRKPVNSLERLWAYLTVKQILKNRETATNTTELTKKALDLALKYSFVTSVSSLVVVKPNQMDAVEIQSANPEEQSENRMFDSSGVLGYDAFDLGARNPEPIYSPSFIAKQRSSSRDSPSFLTTERAPEFQVAIRGDPPTWLQEFRRNNVNITTSQGTFKLSKTRYDNYKAPYSCTNSPEKSLWSFGLCTDVFYCPQNFRYLTNLTVYLQYFCPLEEFAGVCCINYFS